MAFDRRLALVPQPRYIEHLSGFFALGPQAALRFAPEAPTVRETAELLAGVLRRATGFGLPVRPLGALREARGDILLDCRGEQQEAEGGNPLLAGGDITHIDESYSLLVSRQGVQLKAATPAGLARGVQTIRQLLPPEVEAPLAGGAASAESPSTTAGRRGSPLQWAIPCLRIEDAPRFGWRGLLFDCSRHFMQAEFVKRIVDLLAYHKMNVLHWHLTEDQGWRLEIRSRPRLTEVGAWRGANEPYGGYYTQAQVRDIVRYAAERYVMVVPEIEMPGHAMAALASYPELSCTGGPFAVETRWGIIRDVFCAGNEEVFALLEDVLGEVTELFPSPYVHIGADECPKDRWRACPKCQERMRRERLADEEQLQGWFVQRVARMLAERGRRTIGWDEIMEGEPARDAVIVQAWRGWLDSLARAARMGYRCIASSNTANYLDYTVAQLDLAACYLYEPAPEDLSEEERARILGGECCLWTEYCDQSRVEVQLFPRLLAVAENLWSGPTAKDVAEFARRARAHTRRLERLGVAWGAGFAFGREPC